MKTLHAWPPNVKSVYAPPAPPPGPRPTGPGATRYTQGAPRRHGVNGAPISARRGPPIRGRAPRRYDYSSPPRRRSPGSYSHLHMRRGSTMTDSEPQEPGNSGREFHDAAAPHPPRPPHSLLLCGARLADGRTVDVRLAAGRIEAVGTAGSLRPAPRQRHPDRPGRLSAAPRPRRTARPPRHRARPPTRPARRVHGRGRHGRADPPAPATRDDVQRRTTEAALLQLGHGATALRTHVRIGGRRRAALAGGRSPGPPRRCADWPTSPPSPCPGC